MATDEAEVLREMLRALMHGADRKGVSFSDALKDAQRAYEIDCEEEPKQNG